MVCQKRMRSAAELHPEAIDWVNVLQRFCLAKLSFNKTFLQSNVGHGIAHECAGLGLPGAS